MFSRTPEMEWKEKKLEPQTKVIARREACLRIKAKRSKELTGIELSFLEICK